MNRPEPQGRLLKAVGHDRGRPQGFEKRWTGRSCGRLCHPSLTCIIKALEATEVESTGHGIRARLRT